MVEQEIWLGYNDKINTVTNPMVYAIKKGTGNESMYMFYMPPREIFYDNF